ncbi:MAG: hypothetical protein DRP22_01190 [Verrucomicrobia bacterium]|nr:MAG: hypothetical protein DRP22_01190 [Verrucomicrobiota bacterium]
MFQALTPEVSGKIDGILQELLVRAEADAVYLCDHAGNIIARQTCADYSNEDNIAALAAGSFSATHELARLIGQPRFDYVFHRGENLSVYMQRAPSGMILMVMFGTVSNPGLVRVYAEEAIRELKPLLAGMADEARMRESLAGVEMELDEHAEIFRREGGEA